jgi:hypothetical protein
VSVTLPFNVLVGILARTAKKSRMMFSRVGMRERERVRETESQRKKKQTNIETKKKKKERKMERKINNN